MDVILTLFINNQNRCNAFNCPVGVRHHRSFSEIHISALPACFPLTYSFSQPCQRAVRGVQAYILQKERGTEMQSKPKTTHFDIAVLYL